MAGYGYPNSFMRGPQMRPSYQMGRGMQVDPRMAGGGGGYDELIMPDQPSVASRFPADHEMGRIAGSQWQGAPLGLDGADGEFRKPRMTVDVKSGEGTPSPYSGGEPRPTPGAYPYGGQRPWASTQTPGVPTAQPWGYAPAAQSQQPAQSMGSAFGYRQNMGMGGGMGQGVNQGFTNRGWAGGGGWGGGAGANQGSAGSFRQPQQGGMGMRPQYQPQRAIAGAQRGGGASLY